MSNPNAKHSQMAPLARAVRAYIAPVGRPSGPIVAFDPAAESQFDLDAPPSSWLDLGYVENFQRTAATKYEALRNGPLGNITVQYRTPARSASSSSICHPGASCRWRSPAAQER